MAQKITQLTQLTTPELTDVLPIIDDPGGTPLSKKITASDLIKLVYPIGSIYISVASTNPSTVFGFGTWVSFGAGKVLVGLDSGDAAFDVAEETGGEKTHTLDTGEMPTHTHVQNAHSHTEQTLGTTTGGVAGLTRDTSMSGSVVTVGVSTADTTATNQNAGSGNTHNNLQPYIVVYMFKRTA